MALVPHKIVALAQSDAEGTGGQNIVAGAVVSLFDSGGVAIQLHDDASGSNPNTVKTTDSNGVRVVWVTPGEYDEAVNGSTLRKVSIGGRSASEVDTFANLQLYRPTNTGQSFICQDRAGAKYILQADGYTAEAGDVTFANGRVGALQLDYFVMPEFFGAVGDGAADDKLALDSAIAKALSNNSTVKPAQNGAVYRISATLQIPNGRFNLDMTGSSILVDAGVATGVQIGVEGPNPYRGRIEGLRVEKAIYDGMDTGISLINVVEAEITSPQVINFAKSYGSEVGNSGRVSYNYIENPLGQNHEYGFYFKPTGTGYVNENTIMAGRMSAFVSGRLKDHIHLDNSGNSGVGHNRFIGVSIEGFSGGGSTGLAAVRVLNNANGNLFLFCRGERYGAGWADDTYVFGTNTARNVVHDSRIDTTISDADGSNDFILPNLGINYSDVTGGDAHSAFKYTRNVINNDESKKFAIDIEDTASSSGKVGAFKYVSPRTESRSGTLIDLETGYGQVLRVDDAGTILPRDNFADLGSDTNRYRKVETLSVNYSTKSAASADNLSLFVDSADGKLKFKDGAGTVNILY